MPGMTSSAVVATALRQISERELQELLELVPTERLFREYLHRVIRAGREAPNDYAAVVSLLDEFSA